MLNADPNLSVYQWTTKDDEIAEDAIMVGIAGSSTDMIAAGYSYIEPQADIYWCSRVTPMGFFEAGGEMRFLPQDALNRAAELCHEMGYVRVVVTLQEVGIWRPEWGRLADKEGF